MKNFNKNKFDSIYSNTLSLTYPALSGFTHLTKVPSFETEETWKPAIILYIPKFQEDGKPNPDWETVKNEIIKFEDLVSKKLNKSDFHKPYTVYEEVGEMYDRKTRDEFGNITGSVPTEIQHTRHTIKIKLSVSTFSRDQFLKVNLVNSQTRQPVKLNTPEADLIKHGCYYVASFNFASYSMGNQSGFKGTLKHIVYLGASEHTTGTDNNAEELNNYQLPSSLASKIQPNQPAPEPTSSTGFTGSNGQGFGQPSTVSGFGSFGQSSQTFGSNNQPSQINDDELPF